jgi:hypothetical protein
VGDEERFWSYVKKGDECWEWMGNRSAAGYGRLWWKGKMRQAHVVSWWLANGRRPRLNVLHDCDNRACVRPEHLSTGTQRRNMREAAERGRVHRPVGETNGTHTRPDCFPRGEERSWSKLTDEKVREARRRVAAGERVYPMAREYGVSGPTLYDAVKGKTWRHVK